VVKQREPLSDRQRELVQKPNKRYSPDNYQKILQKTRSSVQILQAVSELMPLFEKYSDNYGAAALIAEQFSTEKIAAIIDNIFQIKRAKGAPYSRIFSNSWDENPTSAKIQFANYLLAVSSSYLLKSFPEEKSKYLSSRINDVIVEIENNLALLDEIKKLKIQIESYQEHTSNFIPTYPLMDDDRYGAICIYCREKQLGETVEDAIIKLKHTAKCKTKEINEKKLSIGTIRTWYSIIPPESIRDQFEFFNKTEP